MNLFGLPPTGRSNPPAFLNARSCREWLEGQPWADPAQSQARLLGQLNPLNRFTLQADERLRILEQMRESIYSVQSDCARKFAGRPLPLAPGEKACFDANQALWETLRTGYLRCLNACLEGDAKVSGQSALIAHRALHAMSMQQLDTLRAPHMPPSGFWRTLHQILFVAERLRIIDSRVVDPLQPQNRDSTVHSAYASILLLNAASPYALPYKQIQVAHRWLSKWGGKADISSAPAQDGRIAPVAIDLDQDSPSTHPNSNASNLRWLSLEKLARSVKRRVRMLEQGESPDALRLGREFPREATIGLLMHIYRHCCRGGFARTFPRRDGHQVVQLIAGADCVIHALAGQHFVHTQPNIDSLAASAGFDRHSLPPPGLTLEASYQIERWEVIDESPGGMRLVRLLDQPGVRLGPSQLLALSSDGGDQFQLGSSRWALNMPSGELHSGVQVFAGRPQVVGIRRISATVKDPLRSGFVLPEVTKIGQPACIITPVAWYRKDRELEVIDGPAKRIRLTGLVERGTDFERATFEAA